MATAMVLATLRKRVCDPAFLDLLRAGEVLEHQLEQVARPAVASWVETRSAAKRSAPAEWRRSVTPRPTTCSARASRDALRVGIALPVVEP
jgi:hypothetical protein